MLCHGDGAVLLGLASWPSFLGAGGVLAAVSLEPTGHLRRAPRRRMQNRRAAGCGGRRRLRLGATAAQWPVASSASAFVAAPGPIPTRTGRTDKDSATSGDQNNSYKIHARLVAWRLRLQKDERAPTEASSRTISKPGRHGPRNVAKMPPCAQVDLPYFRVSWPATLARWPLCRCLATYDALGCLRVKFVSCGAGSMSRRSLPLPYFLYR